MRNGDDDEDDQLIEFSNPGAMGRYSVSSLPYLLSLSYLV